ncbi:MULTISPECIES: CynX/NimT family MFS transporter [Streptomyces]|uniref:CynX/NimT family MFS transporter n=1 Tax=Streptomyces koelreuteriae TaxID=2838015 RepID=A0ABX8FZN8_9ACTN|nr:MULTISPECIES: CynX/NimT family MFS transporter [Streptomyces]QWB26508.1 CynX/NimT family MFS transporter [Streptomyces koelreuteriae]UUA09587.1 CynX/NimT family MFS transporter [Streptomyces koelreuteriae]UUA17191.1 CynX/NimT family MFS transporter [Streptomyces sp. CRCS-T-1]
MMGLMASEETRTMTPPTVRSSAAHDAGKPGGPSTRAWTTRLLVLGIVLSALNLRPAITSLGALLEEVRDGLGMSGSVAGLLTSVPPLCFAVFGVMAPRLARRFGAGAVVCAGMVAIASGLAIRPYAGGTAGFLAASALALMGIAVSNVLMPVIVKQWFPDRVGSMTGVYSMGLALGTALAAAVTVPVSDALGGSWQSGLALWAGLAVAAILPWLPFVRGRAAASGPGRRADGDGDGVTRGPDAATETSTPVRTDPTRVEAPQLRITRSRTAWALAVFFGLQATAAYITMGWMAQIFRDAGVPAGTAGLLLALTMVMGVPLAFVIPRLATRLPHQGPIVLTLGVCGLIGYAGLYLAPAEGAWAWALLLGIANCAFPLALTMVGMRAKTGPGVAQLSAFAQSTGYLISIPGPLLVGVLYQHSGGWGLPLTLMGALMVPQMVVGWLAGRDRTVEEEAGR